jgi:hypothetical protein
MTKANLVKVIIVMAVGAILALIVAAPLVGAKNSTNSAPKAPNNKHAAKQDLQSQSTNPVEPTTPTCSDPGFHWASIATNNGTPAVRSAGDSSTSVTSNTGTPGAYTVTFPTIVHVLGCTATPNNETQNGTPSATQGTISCGPGDDTGLKPNQVEVNNPAQGSNFTLVAYDTPSTSG